MIHFWFVNRLYLFALLSWFNALFLILFLFVLRNVASPTKDLITPLKRVCQLSQSPLGKEDVDEIVGESEDEDPLRPPLSDTLITAVYRHGCSAEGREALWPVMIWRASVRSRYQGTGVKCECDPVTTVV